MEYLLHISLIGVSTCSWRFCVILKLNFDHALSTWLQRISLTWGLCPCSFTLEESNPVLKGDPLTNVCHNALTLFFVETFISKWSLYRSPASQRGHKLTWCSQQVDILKICSTRNKTKKTLKVFPACSGFGSYFPCFPVNSDTADKEGPISWNLGEVFHSRGTSTQKVELKWWGV